MQEPYVFFYEKHTEKCDFTRNRGKTRRWKRRAKDTKTRGNSREKGTTEEKRLHHST